MGDITNTASRLEELNKHLGTRKLASAATPYGTDDAVCQYVRRFVFKGKSKAVEAHKILWRDDLDREA